jgi:hypothetical protein
MICYKFCAVGGEGTGHNATPDAQYLVGHSRIMRAQA